MRSLSRSVISQLSMAALCATISVGTLTAQISVKRVQVLGSKDAVEIEVEASDRITPQTQVLTGPDRLVIDFPNATPGADLRSQSVFRGQVKDLRVGLFHANPPVTRIVLDLKSAQSYQVFPGRTVMIKVLGSASGNAVAANDYPAEPTRPGLVVANYVQSSERVSAAVVKPLDVSFRDGQLAIHANKATLSEVLYAVQQRTGAEIAIAAGAEQEKVVVDLGPGPAPEVLAQLLNGSKFNFLILSAASDPRQLDRVILSPRVEGGYTAPLPPVTQNDDASDDDETPAQPAPAPARPVGQRQPTPPVQVAPPAAMPEIKGDDDSTPQ